MKKALIFDLDGTLWDSRDTITNAWNYVFKKNNIDLTINKKQLDNILGMTSQEIKETFFKDINNIDDIMKECENTENIFIKKQGGILYPNTIETLKKLSTNYDLYIISNCQKGYIESFLEYYNITYLFKDIECSGNTLLNKEQNIKLVIARNKITNAIYIGDTYKDYISALNNNIEFIYARYGFGNLEYYNYINNINELITKLKENN